MDIRIKYLLLCFLSINLFALELSISRAKQNSTQYSILNLSDKTPFVCEEILSQEFDVDKIICAFSQKPTATFRPLQNNFFQVTTSQKDKTFFLIIKPFHKMKLYSQIFNLVDEDTIFAPDVGISKQWMIMGYETTRPFLKSEEPNDMTINFPFLMDKDVAPYVGGLDLKGNPINLGKSQDVKLYIKTKKLYKLKKYEQCLKVIAEINSEYPSSIFNAELLYHKVKVFEALKDYESVIESAKVYLQEYSSNENTPEILSLIAKSYALMGMNGDADYFFDRLFSEHENSEFVSLGYIYKADMLESNGGASKAIELYKKALFRTKNIHTGAMSAYKLAKHYISVGDKKNALKYVDKIVEALPSYFIEDREQSLKMMSYFEDASEFVMASKIAQSLLVTMKKDGDDYERLLKSAGIWLAGTEKKDKSLELLNRYIKEFQFGDYIDAVHVAKDSLFFDSDDSNSSFKLQEFDKLIATYQDDSIGNRAIYEKAKLLQQMGKFSQALEMQESLKSLDKEIYKDIDKLIKNLAVGAMEKSLKSKKCKKVIAISSEHNITLSDSWDDGIYMCGMKGGNYKLAKSVATKNLNSKKISERKKWLYRHIKIDFTTGKYDDVIEASKELIVLIKDDKNSPYKDIYRYLFDTYQRVDKNDEMLNVISDIENVYGKTHIDIERYVAVMSIGSAKKDDIMVIKYGNMAHKIQIESNAFIQSPFVEFTLYQSYVHKDNYNQALRVIKSLDTVTLGKKKRARQKYMLGVAYSNLWREEMARKAYQEAIDADPTSPWAKLAKSAMEL